MASKLSFPIVTIAILLVGVTSVLADGAKSPIAQFSYGGETGPTRWGSLDSSYAACSSGKTQSPVNISSEAVHNKNLKPLERDYKKGNGTLINDGHGIAMDFKGGIGSMVIDGKSYTFEQMHWHTPSEHLLDGEQFPLELHLVHKTTEDNIAVVGILFRYGDTDPFLAKLKKSLDETAMDKCGENEISQVTVNNLDTKHLRRNSRKYYRYIGSLTTPPCTENVIWTILGKVRSVSKSQVETLTAPLQTAFKNNARPVQPLNDRKLALKPDHQVRPLRVDVNGHISLPLDITSPYHKQAIDFFIAIAEPLSRVESMPTYKLTPPHLLYAAVVSVGLDTESIIF
ncbi:hypothetical protein ACFE04_001554 [Oxalis oulophora]